MKKCFLISFVVVFLTVTSYSQKHKSTKDTLRSLETIIKENQKSDKRLVNPFADAPKPDYESISFNPYDPAYEYIQNPTQFDSRELGYSSQPYSHKINRVFLKLGTLQVRVLLVLIALSVLLASFSTNISKKN